MLTHGSVVGPGTGTPQCRTTLAGEPHAAVDWASVSRRWAPATVSGRATMMAAQSAFLASGAGSRETVGAHPVSPPAANPRRATAAAKRSPRRRGAPEGAGDGRGTLRGYRSPPRGTVHARPPGPA